MIAPPRLAERLLRWSLPEGDSDAVLGDLHEEFGAIADRAGAPRARRWYWHQTVLSLGPNLVRRLRRHSQGRRRFETDELRQSRMRARTWALLMVAIGVPGVVWSNEAVPWMAALYVGVFGVVTLVKSFVPRRPLDAYLIAITRRRVNLFWICYFFSLESAHLFGPTPLVANVQWTALLIGGLILVWPRTYWVFGSSFVPKAPQIRAPFIGPHRARDGSLSLTIDAPDTPVSVSDLIVVRDSGPRLIGIRRVFSNVDTLRVYAAIGQGSGTMRATVDLLDSSSRVVRSVPVTVMPAELVNRGVPARTPKTRPAQIDACVGLHGLPPGDYQIRVVAADEVRRAERRGEFRIRE